MRVVSSLTLALALSAPSLALAQPSSGTVFISGGAFAAIEQAPTTSGFGVPDADASGTVAGGAQSLGAGERQARAATLRARLHRGHARDDVGEHRAGPGALAQVA